MAYIGKNPKWNSSTFSPQSTEPSSPTEGMIYYDDGTNRAEGLYQYKDGQWQELGSSASGINYIDNNNAEGGTTGWATYADAAGTEPVDGTGGSATTTFTATTTTPLRGVSSFLLSKDAADRQGEGVSFDFTIDESDKAKMLNISFDYNVTADFSDDDIRVFVYDVTNSNLIRLSNENVKSLDNSLNSSFKSFFQTAVDSTSYRLIIHIATTNASSYDLKFDNVTLGPVLGVNPGAFVSRSEEFTTDVGTWISGSTSNPSFGTTSLNKGYYSRVGDKIHLEWYYRQTAAGTAGSGSYIFTLPDGLHFDTTRISGGGTPSIETIFTIDNGLQVGLGHIVLESGSTNQFRVITQTVSGTRAEFGSSAFPLSNASLNLKMSLQAPIAGWEVAVTPNEIQSGRLHAMQVEADSAQSLTHVTFTKLTNWGTPSFDESGAWDSANNKYVVPESGYYSANGQLRVGNDPDGDIERVIINFYVNGVNPSGNLSSSFDTNVAAGIINATKLLKLNKGDEVEMYAFQDNSDADTLNTTSGADQFFEIYKLNDLGGVIQPTETVAAEYISDSGQSLGTSLTDLEYEDKVTDTHNAYNTSTGVYTVPVSGRYSIQAAYKTDIITLGTSQRIDIAILVNGTSKKFNRVTGTGGNTNFVVGTEYQTDLVAGDEVKVQGVSSVSTNLSTSNVYNVFSIVKVGNK